MDGFPLGLPEISYSSVTLADVDKDGDIEIIAGDLSGQVFIWDLPYPYDKEKIPWGKFRHDNWNTGLYGFDPTPAGPLVLNTSVCYGDSVYATGENIRWYLDAELTEMIHSGNYLQTNDFTTGDHTYYVTQSVFGKESVPTEVILTIKPLPQPPVADDIIACYGQTIADLTAYGENISWYGDGELTDLLCANDTFTTGQTEPGTYIYFVTQDSVNCVSPADTVTLTIIESPEPEAHDLTICEGVIVPDLSVNGENIRWYADSMLANLIYTGNNYSSGETEPGQYTYFVTRTLSGCESDPGTAVLTINPSPVIDLGADTTLYPDQTLMLGPYPGEFTYQWNDGTVDPYYTVFGDSLGLGEHFISVLVIDTNGCSASDTVTIHVIPPNAISYSRQDQSIFIYPNPATDVLNIDLEGDFKYPVHIDICDQNGNVIVYREINSGSADGSATLNVSGLPAGIYYLKVITERGIYIVKSVVF